MWPKGSVQVGVCPAFTLLKMKRKSNSANIEATCDVMVQYTSFCVCVCVFWFVEESINFTELYIPSLIHKKLMNS